MKEDRQLTQDGRVERYVMKCENGCEIQAQCRDAGPGAGRDRGDVPGDVTVYCVGDAHFVTFSLCRARLRASFRAHLI